MAHGTWQSILEEDEEEEDQWVFRDCWLGTPNHVLGWGVSGVLCWLVLDFVLLVGLHHEGKGIAFAASCIAYMGDI
jgi:hypothetical protein